MTDSINSLAFIFSKSKTIIKCDKKRKYLDNCCSNSNYCINNLYKVCIFKLEEQYFISSTLNLCTKNENAWELFKCNVTNLLNAFFIISVKKCTSYHSFNAKLIKCKKCDCCNAILLYFKFNIMPFGTTSTACSECIPITCDSNIPYTSSIIPNYWPSTDPEDNHLVSYNRMANYAYEDLKSYVYRDIKFYYNDKYAANLCFKPPSFC